MEDEKLREIVREELMNLLKDDEMLLEIKHALARKTVSEVKQDLRENAIRGSK